MFILVEYKRSKANLKEVLKLLLIIYIVAIPPVFLDLRFYYEYINNPEVKEIIEVENKVTK